MIGIIGGSGLYALLDDFKVIKKESIETPYGATSDELVHGEINGQSLVFLPRHGSKHSVAPHKINYRANIWALKNSGVTSIIAVNAVGGIHDDFPPEKIGFPDQIIDYSWGREFTFFDTEESGVVHTDFSYPYDETLRQGLIKAAQDLNIDTLNLGTYACTQGPRLETAAEIKRLERDGCDMVGMTAMPEAALARELDIAYASINVCANWAAGKQTEILDIETIMQHLNNGISQVQEIILKFLKNL